MNARNQIRNLAEVVTLEAWHEADFRQGGSADLCVNVAFSAGRIGSAASDTVRFRLTLKQAEIVVVIPPGEPAKVDPGSVKRDSRRRTAVATETRKRGREGSLGGALGLGIGATGAKADAKVDAAAKASASVEKVMEVKEALGELCVEHGLDEAGRHRWRVTPALDGPLLGRVWEDDAKVRLAVIDTRADRSIGLPPSVRVEVRCRREDLEISDIVLSDEPKAMMMKRKVLQRNRQIAAEAYLKNRLFLEGLLDGGEGDLSNPFALMTLAVVSAETV
jgi:hypothetical protein